MPLFSAFQTHLSSVTVGTKGLDITDNTFSISDASPDKAWSVSNIRIKITTSGKISSLQKATSKGILIRHKPPTLFIKRNKIKSCNNFETHASIFVHRQFIP